MIIGTREHGMSEYFPGYAPRVRVLPEGPRR